MFGPCSRRTSASSRTGTIAPGRRVDRQVARSARSRRRPTDRTSPPGRTPSRDRRCGRRSRRRSSFRSPRRRRPAAGRTARSPARLSTNRTNGTSICCSSDRSATPGTPAIAVADALAQPAERAEVVAEHLDRDIRARARQHVIDPVRDRLPDRHVGARQRRELPAQLGQQLGRGRSVSRRPTSISAASTPCTCSSYSARPVRRAVATTSGCASRICSTRRPISSDLASDVPGSVFACTVRLPSWNSGRNARARARQRRRRPRRAAPSAADDHGTGWSRTGGSSAREPRLQRRASASRRDRAGSTPRCGRNAKHSAGVTTIATASDASSATM